MNFSSTFTPAKDVVARQVGGETVILDLESGTYFGLDPVGTRIWTLLEAGHSLQHVCDVLLDEYEVSRDDVERDVPALVTQLVDKKLLHPV